MASQYIIDLDGCFCRIQQIVAPLPSTVAVLPNIEILKLTLRTVFGYESRRDIKHTQLFEAFANLYIPTDYCIETTERLIDAVDDYIYRNTRLRPHYTQHTYELPNFRTLVIHEGTVPFIKDADRSGFWLDEIEDYYVGSAVK